MKVLVTGHDGYVGRAVLRRLEAAGHDVTGLDAFWLDGSAGGAAWPGLACDVRDASGEMLRSFDAVVHLAGLCNDPLGDLAPALTDMINTRAAIDLAAAARGAGVARFVFASSCSVYGDAGSDWVDETAAPRPLTPYARSKLAVERALATIAGPAFSPTSLRLGTAWGFADRMRGDLVVNELVVLAASEGVVRLRSDGSAWRPLVHVDDLARAFAAALGAPRERVHGAVLNVVACAENHRIADVAAAIAARVPGARVERSPGAGADARSYRVRGAKLATLLPDAAPKHTLADGLESLLATARANGLDAAALVASRHSRLACVQSLRASGRLDAALRWRRTT